MSVNLYGPREDKGIISRRVAGNWFLWSIWSVWFVWSISFREQDRQDRLAHQIDRL
jgi:hypothetical protein